jgi:hypothetical protein
MTKKVVGVLGVFGFGLVGIACGSSGGDGNGTPGDEQDIKGGCAPVTTLTCAPGYQVTEDGCASSRVAGATPYGRCVKTPDPGVCAPVDTLHCASGDVVSEDGCAQSRVAGATPYGKCVKGAACGDTFCGPKQQCCNGIPFPKPTCFNGIACPISQRKFKKDVSYLSDDDRQRLNDELMSFRLATYHYKAEGEADREHLGFIIDDIAPSAAVMQSGERVDLYGYSTMAVAALQVQAKEITDLRRQVDDLKREIEKNKKR